MKNFRIIDEQIYAGSSPSLQDLKYLKNILDVKNIISLDENEGNKLKNIIKFFKIKQFIIPLDSKTYLDTNIKYLINNFVNFIKQNQPIFIHCLHGQDRTSFVQAIYEIKGKGISFKQALNNVKKFGFGNGVPKNTKNFWENILYLLDQNSDIAMNDDYVLNNLRDTYRIDESGIPQGYQRGFLGPSDVLPNNGLSTRFNKIQEKNSLNKIPEIGVNKGLGPMRGFGPVEHSAISEFN